MPDYLTTIMLFAAVTLIWAVVLYTVVTGLPS